MGWVYIKYQDLSGVELGYTFYAMNMDDLQGKLRRYGINRGNITELTIESREGQKWTYLKDEIPTILD